jgi:hypothetical protein
MNYTATAVPPVAVSFAPAPSTWLRLAVVYLMVGVALGIAMGATENFTLRPVHAHLNLLGWTTLALSGLVYSVYPKAAASRLARIHFWLHNLSLPVMMGSLAALLFGHTEVVPALVMSEFVAAGGIIVFACNIFLNVTPQPAQRDSTVVARAARG